LMSIYSIFAITASITCFVLAAVIYLSNRKGPLNRIFILAIVFGAYAAFTTFMVIEANNFEAAYLWNKIGFLRPFFGAFLFQFALVFTGASLSTSRLRYVLLYMPAALFSIVDLITGEISGSAVAGWWGYQFAGSGSLFYYASTIWSLTLSFASALLCLIFFFRTKDEIKKQQAKIITFGLVIPIGGNLIFTAAQFISGVYIPYYFVGANSILCVFVAYAIWKYNLFDLNPAIAAENIIATMPDSFILTDLEGKIIRVNSALTGLFGYTEKELAGKTISHLLSCKNNRQLISDIMQKHQIKNYETLMVTKFSVDKQVSISASVIKDKKGKNLGTTFIIHDLTRRKKNEERILRNERFVAIGELAGMVGHDLRNPLTSIQAAAYYLKKKNSNLDDTSKEMLAIIETSIQYSNKIVNDLLDYSREIKLKIEETSAKNLLENTLAIMRVPKTVTVVDHTLDSNIVHVDRVNMSRVFMNIINNAFEAMPNGGTLTIKSTEKDDNLKVSFEDTGSGMTKQTISNLWTPLFTTKARGMGFGLPICKRIVETHNGNIQVTSTPNKGTTFTITIPKKRCAQETSECMFLMPKDTLVEAQK
jgi:PAS domain S-box-containing protein